MERKISFHDLREALAQPGCALCRLKARTADQVVEALLWEQVNDPGLRRRVRQARGFCHEHAWLLVRQGASLGVAILLHDVLQDLLDETEAPPFQPPPPLSLRRAQEALDRSRPSLATAALVARLEPHGPCPVCRQVEAMEGVYFQTLVEDLLGEDGLLDDFQASDGLCLPHFRQALALVREREAFDALLFAQRRIWQDLADRLSESIRKSDYRFRDEPLGEEAGSWLMAIVAVAGTSQAHEKLWATATRTGRLPGGNTGH
ncbi:MAG: DUF6062 family protein [Anaerolineae bacterium]